MTGGCFGFVALRMEWSGIKYLAEGVLFAPNYRRVEINRLAGEPDRIDAKSTRAYG